MVRKQIGKMTYKVCLIGKRTIEVGKLWKWQVGSLKLKTNYHIWWKDLITLKISLTHPPSQNNNQTIASPPPPIIGLPPCLPHLSIISPHSHFKTHHIGNPSTPPASQSLHQAPTSCPTHHPKSLWNPTSYSFLAQPSSPISGASSPSASPSADSLYLFPPSFLL